MEAVFRHLKQRMVEQVLQAELTEHLGYPPGEGRGADGNARKAPRRRRSDGGGHVAAGDSPSRDGIFTPAFVPKGATSPVRQKCFAYARGRTVLTQACASESHRCPCRPSDHRGDHAGDRGSLQQRPLEAVHMAVALDGLRVKRPRGIERQQVVYFALGFLPDGTRDVLVLIAAEENAAFWQRVVSELQGRGVQDILIALIDGLAGFPAAIERSFPTRGAAVRGASGCDRACARSIGSSARRSRRRSERSTWRRVRPRPNRRWRSLPRVRWARRIPRSCPCGSATGRASRRPCSTPCRSVGCSTRPTRSKACTRRCASRSKSAAFSERGRGGQAALPALRQATQKFNAPHHCGKRCAPFDCLRAMSPPMLDHRLIHKKTDTPAWRLTTSHSRLPVLHSHPVVVKGAEWSEFPPYRKERRRPHRSRRSGHRTNRSARPTAPCRLPARAPSP